MKNLSEMDQPRGTRRYNDLTFDPDFLLATRDDGRSIKFTRSERRLLSTMTAQPGRLFTREQLVHAILGVDTDCSDRNVDFWVNRLRRKLNDPARAPRFIATQYGEGYVWIAASQSPERASLMVIGPVRGLGDLSSRDSCREIIAQLHRRMMAWCLMGQEIAFLPDWSSQEGATAFRFSVRIDFYQDGAQLQAGFTLRDEMTNRVLSVIRTPFGPATTEKSLMDVADLLTNALWRDFVRAPGEALQPGGPPLALRLQGAALAFSPSREVGWAYISSRANKAFELDPENAELAVILATCRSSQLVFGIGFDFADQGERRDLEDEIERLVLGALGGVRGDPLLSLAAARLLFSLHRGHIRLVEEILAEVMAASTTFAASLAVSGMVKAYHGELADAAGAYDQALALCEPGSEFEVYLQVLKVQALIALGAREPAMKIIDELLRQKPEEIALYLHYLDPYRAPGENVRRVLNRLTPDMARRLLGRLMFGTAPNYGHPEHARAIVAGPLHHLLERFGPSILPAEFTLNELKSSGLPRALTSGWDGRPFQPFPSNLSSRTGG